MTSQLEERAQLLQEKSHNQGQEIVGLKRKVARLEGALEAAEKGRDKANALASKREGEIWGLARHAEAMAARCKT